MHVQFMISIKIQQIYRLKNEICQVSLINEFIFERLNILSWNFWVFVSFFRPYLLRNFYRIYQPIQDQCPTTDEKRYHHRLVSRKKMIPFSTLSSYTVKEFEHFMSWLSFAPFYLRTEVRGDFNIHGTKYFQDAVFHQKYILFKASLPQVGKKKPSSLHGIF